MNKGERTRLEILNQGMKYSSQFGLADVTIGTMSKLCQMSRTGVISHFENKEDMQIAILQHGEQQFIDNVIVPARDYDPLIHLTNLLTRWAGWANNMFNLEQLNCPFIKAVVEFQNRPDSNVRTFVINQQKRLLDYLTHRVERCIEHGKFNTKISSQNIAYELYSLYLGHAITCHCVSIKQAELMFKDSIARLINQYSQTE